MTPFASPPLVAVRVDMPQIRAFHVARPRILRKLSAVASAPVVLVSAPAGTGKSTAVAEWLRETSGEETDWLSLDDADATIWDRLLPCLVRLGVAVPQEWGAPADACLGPQRVTALAELIARSPRRLTVVFDGCEMRSRAQGAELDHLIRHSMGRLRVVLISRVDPVFPLYRYAFTDSLVELRAADLAFTDAEAGQLLSAAGISMNDHAIEELNARLHGWAAALHLAGRALAGRPAPEQCISTIDTITVSLNEFLIEEVLNQQPDEVRQVMLAASVPQALCPRLVDELGGPGASRAFQSYSELRSLVEPVPEQPGWFRYPALLRELLRARLSYESPGRVSDLHRTTGAWLRREGLLREALPHLAQVPAWAELATVLVDELLLGQLFLDGAGGPLASLARQVPLDLPDPAACLVRASVALVAGQERACARELSALEANAVPGDLAGQARDLSVAMVRALWASRWRDAPAAAEAVSVAERWLDTNLLCSRPDRAAQLATVVQVSAGVAALRRGDLGDARESLLRAVEHAPPSTQAPWRANVLGRLAVVEALQGRLSEAVRRAHESLTCAADSGLSQDEVPPGAHVALALVGVERCDDEVARAHVRAVLASPMLGDDSFYGGLVDAARALTDRADAHSRSPAVRLEAAGEAIAPVEAWLADYLRLEAARRCLADGDSERALAVLQRVRRKGQADAAVVAAAAYAEQGDPAAIGRLLAIARGGEASLGTQVSGLLVETVQRSRHRSPGRARAALDHALTLAAAEDLRRPFRDAGPSVQRWLAADPHFGRRRAWLDADATTSAGEASVCTGHPVLVEPLTAKEREVLGHLAELLTTEEIAEKMFVSVNTVRTHIRSILRKLQVTRRNAAVRRARELELI